MKTSNIATVYLLSSWASQECASQLTSVPLKRIAHDRTSTTTSGGINFPNSNRAPQQASRAGTARMLKKSSRRNKRNLQQAESMSASMSIANVDDIEFGRLEEPSSGEASSISLSLSMSPEMIGGASDAIDESEEIGVDAPAPASTTAAATEAATEAAVEISKPTTSPTPSPSASPSAGPSDGPSPSPSYGPSARPTAGPSAEPSPSPSSKPTAGPSARPSAGPSAGVSAGVSAGSSSSPTGKPVTSSPTTTKAGKENASQESASITGSIEMIADSNQQDSGNAQGGGTDMDSKSSKPNDIQQHGLSNDMLELGAVVQTSSFLQASEGGGGGVKPVLRGKSGKTRRRVQVSEEGSMPTGDISQAGFQWTDGSMPTTEEEEETAAIGDPFWVETGTTTTTQATTTASTTTSKAKKGGDGNEPASIQAMMDYVTQDKAHIAATNGAGDEGKPTKEGKSRRRARENTNGGKPRSMTKRQWARLQVEGSMSMAALTQSAFAGSLPMQQVVGIEDEAGTPTAAPSKASKEGPSSAGEEEEEVAVIASIVQNENAYFTASEESLLEANGSAGNGSANSKGGKARRV